MMKHGEICSCGHEISVLVLFHCCLDTGVRLVYCPREETLSLGPGRYERCKHSITFVKCHLKYLVPAEYTWFFQPIHLSTVFKFQRGQAFQQKSDLCRLVKNCILNN